MKKIMLSLVAAGLITTSAIAKEECATTAQKIGFGTIGVIQGAVIGGPIGALWGLGTVIFASEADGCTKETTKIKSEETITLLVQQETFSNESTKANESSKLDEIKTVENKEVKQTINEVQSFVNFAYDRYHFKTTNVNLTTLNLDSAKSIVVEGHTDAKGTDEYNFALGLKRANSVKEYLIKNNISKDLISVKSYGESSPISNIDAKNRRVDLKITNK